MQPLLYRERGVEVYLLARSHKDVEVTRLNDPFVARKKDDACQFACSGKGTGDNLPKRPYGKLTRRHWYADRLRLSRTTTHPGQRSTVKIYKYSRDVHLDEADQLHVRGDHRADQIRHVNLFVAGKR